MNRTIIGLGFEMLLVVFCPVGELFEFHKVVDQRLVILQFSIRFLLRHLDCYCFQGFHESSSFSACRIALMQWFPTFFLSRRILEKNENYLAHLEYFEYKIYLNCPFFTYHNKKLRQ